MAENTRKRSQTKEKLKSALIELCEEKSYYEITVWDICERAGLYRSTFYRYYDAKDDILREIEHEYIEDTQSLTPTIWTIRRDASEEEMEVYRKELTADMEYHRAHRQICKFLLSPGGDIYFYNKMVESIGQSMMKNIQQFGTSQGKNKEYLKILFATGFVSTIHEWLKKDDCSPREIADFLISMMIKLQ